MKHMLQALLVAFLAASAGARVAAEEQGYVIKFDRSAKVGERFHVKMTTAIKHERTATLAGKPLPPQEQVTAIELEAQAVTEELDKRGLARSISYAVRRCLIVEGGEERPLLAEGTVLVAEGARDGTKFTLRGGGKLTEQQDAALRLLIHMSHEDAASVDEMLGTEQRQKPGASWKMNVDKVVENAAHNNWIIEPKDFEGTVRFVGVEKADGRECVKLTSESRTKRLHLKKRPQNARGAEHFPDGFKLTAGTRETSSTSLHGADPADKYSKTTATSVDTYTIEGKSEDGSDYKLSGKMTHTAVVEWVPR